VSGSTRTSADEPAVATGTTSPETGPAVPLTLRWWFRPVPLARIAVFRVIAYLFIPVDVFITTAWVGAHAEVPTAWYSPLLIGRLLHLPTPTHTVVLAVQWALVIAAVAAATGRAPRLLGSTVFLLYAEWMVIAMSYGKVDHDRIAFLVALALLPTIGRARFRDRRSSEAAGFAMAAVLMAIMLTYFLAAWAKIRFGGWDWPTGATIARAVVRRGSVFSDWTLNVPHLLPAVQWAMIIGELAAPLLLLVRTDRMRVGLVLFLLSFHVITFLGLGIVFLPHCIAILSIAPWERLRGLGRRASPAPSTAPATG
jgi:hypothetical protein